jgi:uncharacterized protein (DUF924 family)
MNAANPAAPVAIQPDEILNFWFYEIGEARWFAKDAALDALIRERFEDVYDAARHGQLKTWEETPEGMLALLILLDQFPRNMFRGTARAFESDDQALNLARVGITKHFDDRIDRAFKLFFYLPFEHAENMGEQRLSLFYIRERTKNPDWLNYAEEHYKIIQRFGRFPHRNAVLARDNTPEESEYLQSSSAGF